MRIKYFMRGLGSGIVLTAVVVALTTKPKLTDAEIMKRATELGMVSDKEVGLNEGDLTDLSKDGTSNDEDSNINQTNSDNDKESDGNTTDKTQDSTDSENTKEQEDKDNSTDSKTDTSKETANETDKDKETDNKTTNAVKTVTINKGLYSYSVSRVLEDAGVIDSAKEFDQYLVENDFQRRIIPGTYEIKEGTSYNKIAELITK